MIYIISKSYPIKFVPKHIRHFDTKWHFKRENIKGMQKIILKETEVWIISLPLFSHTFSENINYFIFTSLNKYNDAKQHQHYHLVSWRKIPPEIEKWYIYNNVFSYEAFCNVNSFYFIVRVSLDISSYLNDW